MNGHDYPQQPQITLYNTDTNVFKYDKPQKLQKPEFEGNLFDLAALRA